LDGLGYNLIYLSLAPIFLLIPSLSAASPTSASHRPGCYRKSTPELHFCSGAAIGSHHSSLPNCFPFLPSLFWLSADFFESGFGGGRGKGLA
jgi:hypothetical protein